MICFCWLFGVCYGARLLSCLVRFGSNISTNLIFLLHAFLEREILILIRDYLLYVPVDLSVLTGSSPGEWPCSQITTTAENIPHGSPPPPNPPWTSCGTVAQEHHRTLFPRDTVSICVSTMSLILFCTKWDPEYKWRYVLCVNLNPFHQKSARENISLLAGTVKQVIQFQAKPVKALKSMSFLWVVE